MLIKPNIYIYQLAIRLKIKKKIERRSNYEM